MDAQVQFKNTHKTRLDKGTSTLLMYIFQVHIILYVKEWTTPVY